MNIGATSTVADSRAEVRTAFLRKTYGHLAGALVVFVCLEALLLRMPGIDGLVRAMTGPAWLLVLLMFMGVSYVADRWARSSTSLGMQYLGLGLYVVAESILFLPLLYIAARYAGPGLFVNAGLLTLITFGGMTAIVFLTKKDFSGLRVALSVGGMVAFGLIVCSILFGLTLGTWFSVAMIVFASGAILYHTGAVMQHYREDQYVAASLSLFAAVALLLWYVIQLLMDFSRR